MKSTRRSFIKTASIITAPFILPSHIWSADIKPNDRITMGLIGMGRQNKELLNALLFSTQVLAVCDVDKNRREFAKKTVNDFYTEYPEKGSTGCEAYNDFRDLIARKDIDAVCIATPDHWHAIPTLAALRSGKDVYCEKPLTHTIHEAVQVMKAVDENKRILQTGSMQRSFKVFRVCCELVRNDLIGKIKHVECSFGGPAVSCALPGEEIESGLDWDLWLGPAPERPYNSELSPRGVYHFFPRWRRYKEYGGGGVTDWGAHQLDIAQWGLDMDNSGPVKIIPPKDSFSNTDTTFEYKNGITLKHKKGFGVHFFGTDGEVKVNRNKFEFIQNNKRIAGFVNRGDNGSLTSEIAFVEKEFLKDAKIKLYNSSNHIKDFINSMKTRKKPIANEQIGGRSAICCHLINLAYYHRKKLKWDPYKFSFRRNTGDSRWLTKEYRAPWKV